MNDDDAVEYLIRDDLGAGVVTVGWIARTEAGNVTCQAARRSRDIDRAALDALRDVWRAEGERAMLRTAEQMRYVIARATGEQASQIQAVLMRTEYDRFMSQWLENH